MNISSLYVILNGRIQKEAEVDIDIIVRLGSNLLSKSVEKKNIGHE